MATHPTVELKVGSTWTDITGYVRYQDMIEIQRGRSAESSQTDTSTCSMTLDNRDGRFSPRNPSGAYYGSIGRNTPIRVSLDGGLPYLNIPGQDGDRFATPDTAALDIVGDIDVRIELFFLDWNMGSKVELIGKYLPTGNQRSWRLALDTGGFPELTWTADGSTVLSATATTSLATNGRSRMAIRATLDVNNGAGGKTVTFYTADDMDGTWTQLGNAVTTATTTAIYSSTANLQVGDLYDATVTTPTTRIYKAEVRDGIGGTAVANPDFTIQTVGDTSFADAAGRTWTQEGNASISNRKIRFMGEVSSWPVEWDISGTDVVTKIEASGIIRRLTQGDSPLRSPLYRELVNPERTNIVGYWPMEEPTGADSFASGIAGHPAMTFTGSPQFASAQAWAGSESLPAIESGILTATVPNYTVTGETATRFLMHVPSDGLAAETSLMTMHTTGSVKRWEVRVSTIGSLKVLAYDADGTELLGGGFTAFAVNGELNNTLLELTQDGADIDWRLNLGDYTDVTQITEIIPGTTVSGTLAGHTAGRVSRIIIGDGGLAGTTIGHLTIADDTDAYGATADAILGWRGENPTNRLRRILETEEGIPLQIHSRALIGNTVTMGIQDPQSIVDLVREVGDTDLGIMYEPRDEICFAYRSRLSLYNQDPRLELDYSANQLSSAPIPVDDDRYVRNDVTVTREYGSFAEAVLETGTLSVLEPPSGVGRYEEDATISLGTDAQLPDQAGWRLHLGTIDEARYPQISLNLRHSTFTSSDAMMEDALEMDIGDRVIIDNPPSWIPPDRIDLLAVGFTETLGILERDITVNCVAESAFHVTYAENPTEEYDRVDTNGSALVEDLTTTETSVDVLTQADSALWTIDGAQFPFDVRSGGEVMTVTGVTGSVSDTYTRTVTPGWGTPTIGGAWVSTGGAGGDHYTTGTEGAHSLTAVDVARLDLTPVSGVDHLVQVDMGSAALATGGPQLISVVARATDGDNLYMAQLSIATTAVMTLTIRKRVGGVETELATYTTALTHSAFAFYRLRFMVHGTALKARVWAASGLDPVGWQIETTDSSLTSGSNVGCRSVRQTANTNAGLIVQWDNFELLNPQTMTVTRSVNNVVKTHSSGADLRLANPAVISL